MSSCTNRKNRRNLSKCTKKTALGAAAIIGTSLLCGCAKLPFNPLTPTPKFDSTYTVAAEITCDDLTAKADVTRRGADDWTFSFTEPKRLNGVTMTLGADGWSAKLGDLSFSAEDNGIYTLIPEVIGSSIDSLANCTNEDFTVSDGVLTADSEFGGKKVTVTANENGGLISLKCPYHKLSVSFADQQPYTPPDPDAGGLVTDEAQ